MTEERIIQEIENCLRVYQTIVPENREVIFLSHFVTKGERYYQALEKYGAQSIEELNKIDVNIVKNFRKENLNEGEMMKKYLQEQGNEFIIHPGKFFANGWAQKHFAYFWTNVLERYATKHVLPEKFYTSEGGLEEFLTSLEKGIEQVIYPDKKIDIKDSLIKLEDTIIRVKNLGANTLRFEDIYPRFKKFV